MINSKILTVSYGTFSCTLEGFDDSFGTMKAIAEYFRDLASDDRYFGAEPPQPDAEMLARIAQKEVSRRVEAHQRDGKIVLSALQEGADPAAPAATIAVAAAAQAEQTDQTSRVETKVKQAAAVEYVEDENDIVPGQPDAEVEAFFEQTKEAHDETIQSDEPKETLAAETPTGDTPQAPATKSPATESIAAKLQRIRDVVAQNDEQDEDIDYSEDEHAQGEATTGPAEARNVVAEARRDIEDALQADASADLDVTHPNAKSVADGETDDIADILRRLEDDTSAQSAQIKEEAENATSVIDENIETATHQSEEPEAAPHDDGIALDNVFEDDTVAKALAADETVTENPVDSTPVDNASKDPKVEATPEQTSPAAAKAPRARVIKVKRADLEAAIQSGELEEYEDEGEEEGVLSEKDSLSLDDLAPARITETSLSAEEEAELTRELTALEADIQSEAGVDASTQKGRTRLPAMDADQDGDVSRLLAEADNQMGEPESATRRDAFAHLRAAVAAKKADEALGTQDRAKSDDDYRNDLADVVRPRRPVSGGARSKRAGEDRPAPLKLVAEQRIDMPKPTRPAGPVSPRRISKAAEAADVSDNSFVDFANEMGATKLPDLLEAAAAYMSFVEGRENFSRPQLIRKVRQAGPDGFTREDTLRSFGKLLRQGKIEKVKAGQFVASPEIGFHPSRRAAG